MNTPDNDVIDLEDDPREDVLKGKMPRRLLWLFGMLFLFVLITVGILVINNNEPKKEMKETKIIQDKIKKDNIDSVKIVKSIEQSQTEDTASNKGSSLSKELGYLAPNDNSDPNAPNQTHSGDIQHQSDARNLEKIKIGPIFRNGISRSGSIPSLQNNSDSELMNQIAKISKDQTDKFASQNNPEDVIRKAMADAGLNNKPKSNADSQLEFNKEMEAKKFPAPTGVVEKSNSSCLLRPGWLIPVANIENMNSDIPGEITLLVRKNVYGSYNNECLAIPAGSTIVATYNPNVSIGQERFNIAATVMHLPNGKRVSMMGTNAYEGDGSSGINADVNNHFFKILGTSLALGVASRLAGNDTVSTSSNAGSSTSTGSTLSKVFGDTAETVLSRTKNIQPTLTRSGATRFNLKISREFFMENYRD